MKILKSTTAYLTANNVGAFMYHGMVLATQLGWIYLAWSVFIR